MARHRLATRRPRASSRPFAPTSDDSEPLLSRVGQRGRHERRNAIPGPAVSLDRGTAEPGVPLGRVPAHLRPAIQSYWADGLDAQAIAERLSGYGVTIQDVLVERYLHPGGSARA